MSEQLQAGPWWGAYELEVDGCAKWGVGPLRFWLYRGSSEWRLAHEWDDDELTGWSLDRSSVMPGEDVETERFAVREPSPRVHLRPLPPDRAVVARPKTAFSVLPEQSARIFVSSPLFVEVSIGNDPKVLRELATKRLSDTWFGATTREGELAYAIKTSARTSLDDMPQAAYRLLSPVLIENRASDPLLVERLSLPVRFLSIYGGETGQAWSEEVRMLRTEDGDTAELDVRSGPPKEASEAIRLSEPRQTAEEGHLFRAFGSLLGLDL